MKKVTLRVSPFVMVPEPNKISQDKLKEIMSTKLYNGEHVVSVQLIGDDARALGVKLYSLTIIEPGDDLSSMTMCFDGTSFSVDMVGKVKYILSKIDDPDIVRFLKKVISHRYNIKMVGDATMCDLVVQDSLPSGV